MLAVVDHVDAGRGLPPHDLVDGARDALIEGRTVVILSELLGVEQRDQVGRPRQAAGVRGQDTVPAGLHRVHQSRGRSPEQARR